jgi:hypothetical protein
LPVTELSPSDPNGGSEELFARGPRFPSNQHANTETTMNPSLPTILIFSGALIGILPSVALGLLV